MLFLLLASTMLLGENVPLAKPTEEYRVYDKNVPSAVRELYHVNHAMQSFDFVLQKKKQYLPLRKQTMGIWEAIDLFDQLVDESDPDLVGLPQSYHMFQTAEAIRKDNLPRWFILTGFLHDLGKILAMYGEPQWAVVGDTFPVGCAFSEKIVFPEYFQENPDIHVPLYQTKYGIYSPHCGLDNVHMSWGHDEYFYHVAKDYLPPEASYIIRFHSFYAAHREDEYEHLMNDNDKVMLPWLKLFSKYDLYSKAAEPLDVEALMPYYKALVAEFFPQEIAW